MDEVKQNIAICQLRADRLFAESKGRQRQIINLLDTDISRYFAIIKFNNSFIIRSPSFKAQGSHTSHKRVVSIAHEQNLWVVICRSRGRLSVNEMEGKHESNDNFSITVANYTRVGEVNPKYCAVILNLTWRHDAVVHARDYLLRFARKMGMLMFHSQKILY